MELGLNFDDGDFDEEQKQKPVLISYNAKICEPRWFLNRVSHDENEDLATVCKFRADYHYGVGEYGQAVECYHQSLDSLARSQNRSMRREIVECLARCYIQTGELTKALEYSNKMLEDCLTSAHFCQALLLQHQIHKTSGKLLDEIPVLHQLIQLHSFHYPFWTLLAEAYTKLHTNKEHAMNTYSDNSIEGLGRSNNSESETHNLPGSKGLNELTAIQTEIEQIDGSSILNATSISDRGRPKMDQDKVVDATFQTGKSGNEHGLCAGDHGDVHVDQKPVVNGLLHSKLAEKDHRELVETTHNSVDCDKILSSYPLELVKLTCLVRVRLILQSYQKNTGSFVNKKNKEALVKVEGDIQDLTTDDGLLRTVIEHMRKDMYDDDSDDKGSKENEPQNVVTSLIPTEDFNKRWFSWINQL